jgi:hypothetical protein
VRRLLVASGVLLGLLGLGLAFAAGWFAGAFTEGQRQADRRFREDCNVAAPILADPAFRRLEPFDFPVNGFSLGGPVPTQADYDRLSVEVSRVFGEPKVGHILADVWVEAAEPGVAPDPRRQ